MNCTICGKKIVLVPSAEERARKDVTGKTAAYYASIFTTHAACVLEERQRSTSELMARHRAGTKGDLA